MSTMRVDSILNSSGAATAQINGITPALASQAEAQTGTDNAKLMTPLRVAQVAIGMGQTWQDVSSSRTNGTSYQNTTGRPIVVSFGNNNVGSVEASPNNSTWVQVGREASGQTYPNIFIVPDGWYYRSPAGGTRFWWAELR